MNHHQRKILHAIFAHPVNANLEMKNVSAVFNGLGAETGRRTKNRVGVKLHGKETTLHLANHTLSRAEVIEVRKFLEACGVTRRGVPRLKSLDRTGEPPAPAGAGTGRPKSVQAELRVHGA